MLDIFLLTNRFVKSLGRSFNRLLEKREIVRVTSRMMNFGKQNRKFLRDVSKKIGFRHLKLNQ